MQAQSSSLIAVDIGNSRIKVGCFRVKREVSEFPIPGRVLELPVSSFDPASLESALGESPSDAGRTEWWIGSVNRTPTEHLTSWLQGLGYMEFDASTGQTWADGAPRERRGYCLLKHLDLPITIELSQPEQVGIDRLLGAVAANRLRDASRSAVILGVGTAITVDLVSPAGTFLGGAILPGIGISARAMHDFTDRLPLVTMEELAEPPPPLGISTIEAMRSGLYWGAVGGMKELVAQLSELHCGRDQSSGSPQIFLTGGAAPVVAQFLDPQAAYVPSLVLSGIALVAE